MPVKSIALAAVAAAYAALIGRASLNLAARVWGRRVETKLPGEAAWDDERTLVRVQRRGRVLEGRWRAAGLVDWTSRVLAPLPPRLQVAVPGGGASTDLLSRDWRLAKSVDVRGGPAWWVQDLLGGDEMRAALLGVGGVERIQLVRGELVRTGPEGESVLSAEIDAVLAWLERVEVASAAAWTARAGVPGLRESARGPLHIRLAGRVQGVPVQLGWHAEGPASPGVIVLDLTIPRPVPGDLVVRERIVDADAPPLGDLVLDRFIAARGAGRATLRALLARDAVRGPLLDLLRGPGDAAVEGPRIRLTTAGPAPDAAVRALPSASELARALSAGGD